MRRSLRNIAILAIALIAFAFIPVAGVRAQNLASFAILGGSAITNTGPSVITGNVGLSPGTAISGFPPGIVVPPSAIFNSDATAIQAQIDLNNAYNILASISQRPTVNPHGSEPGRPYACTGRLQLYFVGSADGDPDP